MQDYLWLKAIFTKMALQTSEYDLRPKKRTQHPDSWGGAPGYGEKRPSAK
jgi:hypothetical protein